MENVKKGITFSMRILRKIDKNQKNSVGLSKTKDVTF